MQHWLERVITRPVEALQKRIETVGSGNFAPDRTVEWNNELGDIGRGINQLAENVDSLMTRRVEDERRKQELEYRMLQNEVNPHFIYNTLNSIRWMATIQHAPGIAEMVTAFARLTKSISKGTQKLVPLQEELALLNDYFTIQQYRYGGDLEIEVSRIESETLCRDCLIPRFTLQPLVENAIFHGLEPKGGHGSVLLDISTDSDTGDVLLRITDDGVGMPPELVAHLLDEPAEGAEKAEKFRHVGLWNVNRRIRYSFGEGYGLTIESEEDVGTEVTIRLPYHRKETAMLRILLVDDEPLVLIGLQGMLEWEKLGYTVCGTARNGKLALELIEREKPDIVIADVKMPVMDGLTLARTCRERSALPAFIMLTSFEEFDYIKQAMGAGVVDYLVKLDLTPENLQTALAKAAEKVKRSVLCWANCRHRKILPRVCAAIRSVFRAAVRRAVPGRSRIGAAFAAHGAEPCKRRLSCSQLRDHRQHRPYSRPAAEAELFLRADAGDHPAELSALLCDRGGCHALQCAVLPDRCPVSELPDGAAPVAGTRQPNSIQLFHGTAALGGRSPHRLPAGAGAPLPGKRPPAAPAHGGAAHPVRGGQRGRRHRREDAGGGTGAGVY